MVEHAGIDSAALGQLETTQLQALLLKEDSLEELDDSLDRHALLGRLLLLKLQKLSDEQLGGVVRNHWADFDLYDEASRVEEAKRPEYRRWLDEVTKGLATLPAGIR